MGYFYIFFPFLSIAAPWYNSVSMPTGENWISGLPLCSRCRLQTGVWVLSDRLQCDEAATRERGAEKEGGGWGGGDGLKLLTGTSSCSGRRVWYEMAMGGSTRCHDRKVFPPDYHFDVDVATFRGNNFSRGARAKALT